MRRNCSQAARGSCSCRESSTRACRPRVRATRPAGAVGFDAGVVHVEQAVEPAVISHRKARHDCRGTADTHGWLRPRSCRGIPGPHAPTGCCRRVESADDEQPSPRIVEERMCELAGSGPAGGEELPYQLRIGQILAVEAVRQDAVVRAAESVRDAMLPVDGIRKVTFGARRLGHDLPCESRPGGRRRETLQDEDDEDGGAPGQEPGWSVLGQAALRSRGRSPGTSTPRCYAPPAGPARVQLVRSDGGPPDSRLYSATRARTPSMNGCRRGAPNQRPNRFASS